jgi:hypothetical protein
VECFKATLSGNPLLLMACLKKAVAASSSRPFDSHGDTLDFMLSERRDEDAATAFFKQAINNNGFPDKVALKHSTLLKQRLHNGWRITDNPTIERSMININPLSSIISSRSRYETPSLPAMESEREGW